MQLRAIDNLKEFENKFTFQFEETRRLSPSLNKFIYEIGINERLFIVGGYLRNIANDEKPRDLDIIVNISSKRLQEIVASNCKNYTVNRLGGYKIAFESIVVDTWSIDDNWAFKNNLIQNFQINYLKKIAEGTFYNYDSLVLDVYSLQGHFDYYNECVRNNCLDIIKNTSRYKQLNPTKEANILRAFYLRNKHNLNYAENLYLYLSELLNYLDLIEGGCISKLHSTLIKYSKYYDYLSNDHVEVFMKEMNSFVTRGNHKCDNLNQLNLF